MTVIPRTVGVLHTGAMGVTVAATPQSTAPKAWRFDGEMAEIVASFAAHDLPTGFGDATREIFGRMDVFKGVDDATLDEVLAVLVNSLGT